MKKILILLLVLWASFAIAQEKPRSTITDKVIVRQSLEMNGVAVTEISIDPTLIDSSNEALVTEAAVKAYVDALVASTSSIDTFYLNATKDTLFIIAPPDVFFAVLDFPTNNEFQDSLSDIRADINALYANKLEKTLTDGQIFVGNGSNEAQARSLSGDAIISNTGVLTLANSGVSAATYGSATQVPVVTFDAKGRATSVTNTSITGLLSGLTTNRIPVATGATGLDNSILLQGANGITYDANKQIYFTGTPTLSLPASAAGGFGYNSTTDRHYMERSTGRVNVGEEIWVNTGSYIYYGDVNNAKVTNDGKIYVNNTTSSSNAGYWFSNGSAAWLNPSFSSDGLGNITLRSLSNSRNLNILSGSTTTAIFTERGLLLGATSTPYGFNYSGVTGDAGRLKVGYTNSSELALAVLHAQTSGNSPLPGLLIGKDYTVNGVSSRRFFENNEVGSSVGAVIMPITSNLYDFNQLAKNGILGLAVSGVGKRGSPSIISNMYLAGYFEQIWRDTITENNTVGSLRSLAEMRQGIVSEGEIVSFHSETKYTGGTANVPFISGKFVSTSSPGGIARALVLNASGSSTSNIALLAQTGEIVAMSRIGAGTGSPTQSIHTTENIRVEGAFYDSNNEAGTLGQSLVSTVTGTDWKSEFNGFQYYDADPGILSPTQGQIFELDATGTVSGWTQQILSTNMCTGCAFTLIMRTQSGGLDITVDSASGDFLADTTDATTSTGSLAFSGSATWRRRVIWTGANWLFLQY